MRDPGSPGGTPPHLGWCRWQPAVRGPGRPLRPALDAGRDRRTPGPLCPVGRTLQARAGCVRARAAADWYALPRIHCANRPGGRRHSVAVLEGDLRESRTRARMGTPDHGQIPGRTRGRIAIYRIARNRRHQIAAMMRLLGLSRFDLAYATGRMPHPQRLATIELYGREVIPRVRELLADHPVPPISSSYPAKAMTAQTHV